MVVKFKIVAFWLVTWYSLMDGYKPFEEPVASVIVQTDKGLQGYEECTRFIFRLEVNANITPKHW
jgi:hypothetical protein